MCVCAVGTVRVYSPADIGRYSVIKTERDHITIPLGWERYRSPTFGKCFAWNEIASLMLS